MSVISEKLRELGYAPYSIGVGSAYDQVTLQRLPELIGWPLPDDYLQFLTEFPNTGTLEGVTCMGLDVAPAAPDGVYPLDFLYASSNKPSLDLLGLRKMQESEATLNRMYLLLIGSDIFSDYYCLDLRKESFGTIYFHDHGEPIETGLYRVANDFTSFIASLRQEEE